MRGLVLVAPHFDLQTIGRLDADINVFREPVNDAKAFRKRCAALQLKPELGFLQAPKGMHDPVVLLDQHRINPALIG